MLTSSFPIQHTCDFAGPNPVYVSRMFLQPELHFYVV